MEIINIKDIPRRKRSPNKCFRMTNNFLLPRIEELDELLLCVRSKEERLNDLAPVKIKLVEVKIKKTADAKKVTKYKPSCYTKIKKQRVVNEPIYVPIQFGGNKITSYSDLLHYSESFVANGLANGFSMTVYPCSFITILKKDNK